MSRCKLCKEGVRHLVCDNIDAKVKARQKIERRIVGQCVADALKAGLTVSVNDGEDLTLDKSNNKRAIMGALFTTDEDYLILHKGDKRLGWVRCVYGNDGWDVIADYVLGLEPYVAGAEALASKIEQQHP